MIRRKTQNGTASRAARGLVGVPIDCTTEQRETYTLAARLAGFASRGEWILAVLDTAAKTALRDGAAKILEKSDE